MGQLADGGQPSGEGTSRRTKRGPTKLPQSSKHCHITEFDQVGEPVKPLSTLGPYKSVIGALVRDFIPIRYTNWTGREDNPCRVPESEKELVWNKLRGYFTFPDGYDEATVKKRAKEIMGRSFKTFKGHLYNKFLKEDNGQPNFDGGEYTKQRDFWEEFKANRLSQEAKDASVRTENSLKAKDPHRLGSRGYPRKIPEWDEEIHKLEQQGVTPETSNWEPRAVHYILGRGAKYNTDGTLSASSESVTGLVQKISSLTEEVHKGIRSSDRENDVLTRALGNKEHPGRTRGVGIVPWQKAFEGESSSYRSRARARTRREEELQRFRQEIEDSMQERIAAQVQLALQSMTQGQTIPTRTSPVRKGRSSCGSTYMPDEEELNAPHPVDDITEPVNVRLYIRQQWTKDKVAVGQAFPRGDGTIHGKAMPRQYVRVSIDKILDKKYNKVHIDYPVEEDRPRLVHNVGTHVPWCRRFIKLDEQSSSDDEDDTSSSASPSLRGFSPLLDEQPSSQPPKEKTPPPPPKEKTPPPPPPPPPPPKQKSPPPPKSRGVQSRPSAKSSSSSQRKRSSASVGNAPQPSKKKKVDASITAKMKDPYMEPASKEAKVAFFNRIASVPKWRAQNEFERQTSKESNQTRAKEIHTQDLLQIQNLANDLGIEMEAAANLYYESTEFDKAPLAYKYVRGEPLVATEQEYKDLGTYMRQLHEYYQINTASGDSDGFDVCILPGLVFNNHEEVVHHVYYEHLFQLYQRRSLDTQILMLWSM